MQKKRGRPPKPPGKGKGDHLQVRLEAAEKEAFTTAAQLAGIDLSAWVRERLRSASRKELAVVGERVAFLDRTANG